MIQASQKERPNAVWHPCAESLVVKPLKADSEDLILQESPCRLTCYLLLFLKAGSLRVTVDNQAVQLEVQQILIVKPNCICQIERLGTASVEMPAGWLLCFDTEFFSLRYHNHQLSEFQIIAGGSGFTQLSLEAAPFDHACQLLDSMHIEGAEKRKGDQQVLRSYLNILLFELERACQKQGDLTPLPGISQKEEKVRQFEQLLEADFSHKKSLSYYSDALYITGNYLNKLCQAVRGCSAGALLRSHALIEAKRKLLFTTHTVSEISYELGYDNPSYFIAFFKKATGYTPEVFRKKER